jgi:hypothetical protein
MLDNDYDYDNDNEPPRDFCTAPLGHLQLALVSPCSPPQQRPDAIEDDRKDRTRDVDGAIEGPLTLCEECDLLQRQSPAAILCCTLCENAICSSPPLPPGGSAHCVRCGHLLHKHRPDSINRTLALTLAGLVLFIIANSFPVSCPSRCRGR